MSDDRLRRLQRDDRGGDRGGRARFLWEQVRAGRVPVADLRLAAALGLSPAAEALEEAAPDSLPSLHRLVRAAGPDPVETVREPTGLARLLSSPQALVLIHVPWSWLSVSAHLAFRGLARTWPLWGTACQPAFYCLRLADDPGLAGPLLEQGATRGVDLSHAGDGGVLWLAAGVALAACRAGAGEVPALVQRTAELFGG